MHMFVLDSSTGTSYSVDNSWNDAWFSVETDSTSPCVTNTSVPINVKYHCADNEL